MLTADPYLREELGLFSAAVVPSQKATSDMDGIIRISVIAIAFAAVLGVFVFGRRILRERFSVREPLATQIAVSAAAVLWLILFIVAQDFR